MRLFYRLKQATRWLMLALALMAGVVPSSLAAIDGGHFGAFGDESSQHSHPGDDSHADDEVSADTRDDHHNAFCTDHCCSDACSAALSIQDLFIISLQNPQAGFVSNNAEHPPTEDRFIPPRRL